MSEQDNLESEMKRRLEELEVKQEQAWSDYVALKSKLEPQIKPFTDQIEASQKTWSDLYNEMHWLKKRLNIPLA